MQDQLTVKCFYCPSQAEEFNMSGSSLQQDVKWWTQGLKNNSAWENFVQKAEKQKNSHLWLKAPPWKLHYSGAIPSSGATVGPWLCYLLVYCWCCIFARVFQQAICFAFSPPIMLAFSYNSHCPIYQPPAQNQQPGLWNPNLHRLFHRHQAVRSPLYL